jgi:cytochrome c6
MPDASEHGHPGADRRGLGPPGLLCGIVRGKYLPQEELSMKYLSIRTGLVAVLALGMLSLCTPSAAAQDAAATYKAKCAMCHGPDGKGGKMGTRDFASPEVQKESDADLTDIITKGKGKMPAYGGKLKDAEIKDLVTYVRGMAKK